MCFCAMDSTDSAQDSVSGSKTRQFDKSNWTRMQLNKVM
jgi:hypothetical protein